MYNFQKRLIFKSLRDIPRNYKFEFMSDVSPIMDCFSLQDYPSDVHYWKNFLMEYFEKMGEKYCDAFLLFWMHELIYQKQDPVLYVETWNIFLEMVLAHLGRNVCPPVNWTKEEIFNAMSDMEDPEYYFSEMQQTWFEEHNLDSDDDSDIDLNPDDDDDEYIPEERQKLLDYFEFEYPLPVSEL